MVYVPRTHVEGEAGVGAGPRVVVAGRGTYGAGFATLAEHQAPLFFGPETHCSPPDATCAGLIEQFEPTVVPYRCLVGDLVGNLYIWKSIGGATFEEPIGSRGHRGLPRRDVLS